MAVEQFYRLARLRPPLGVPVRVIWDGRVIPAAARVAHPQTKREAWLVRDKSGGAVFLPLDTREARRSASDAAAAGAPWKGWHTLRSPAPDYWAPSKPDLWSLPLPEPVALDMDPETQMWSARQSFSAVEAALGEVADGMTAADMARAMERERESARAQGAHGGKGGSGETESAKKRWWRDPTLITYSQPGAISKREAQGRVMRALAGDGAGMMAGAPCGAFEMRLDPDELRAMAEAEALLPPAAIEVFRPLPQDHKDYLTAMAWFAALNPDPAPLSWNDQQKLLLLAASDLPLTLTAMAEVLGLKSRQRAHQMMAAALDLVWEAANGFQTPGGIRRDAALARVRDGNRAARIAGGVE